MSNTTSKKSKAAVLAFLQALISGLQKHYPNGSLAFGNASVTTASIVQVLQGLIDAIVAANTARASARDAVANARSKAAEAAPMIKGLVKLLSATFAGAAQTLADFGIEPPKARKPMSAEVLASRKVKAEATRVKRGTKGPKAKLAIKGDVAGVNVTPVVTQVVSPPEQSVSNASSAPTGASK